MIFLKNLIKDTDASISMEAAFLLPVLILATFGGYDLMTYVVDVNVIDRTSIITADLSSQNTMVCSDRVGSPPNNYDVGVFFNAAYEAAMPLDIVKDGKIIITSITNNGTVAAPHPVITWQVSEVPKDSSLPAFGATDNSKLTATNNSTIPVLPPGFTLNPGENIIAAEIFYKYTPILLGAGSFFNQPLPEIYRVSFYRPRQGDLSTLLPNTDSRCQS